MTIKRHPRGVSAIVLALSTIICLQTTESAILTSSGLAPLRLISISAPLLVLSLGNLPIGSFGAAADDRVRKEAEALLERKRKLPAQGQEEEQAQLLRRAAELSPTSTVIFQELAVLQIQRLLRTKAADDADHPFLLEAVRALSTLALLTQSNQASTWGFINQLLNFGHQAEGKDRPLFAQQLYEAAVLLNPDHGNAVASRYKIREWLCEWEGRQEALAEVLRRVKAQLDSGQAPSLQPLVAVSQDVEMETQRRVAQAWVRLYRKADFQRNRFFLDLAPPKLSDNRLTVAYMSGDLRGHAVSHQMLAVFHQHAHPSSRIRVVVLNTFQGNIGGEGREIQGLVHQWVDIKGGDDDQVVAARIVNDLRVHVIVEMSGHTGGHRMGALSLRPAPLALSFLGFPASTGADFIDFFISDRIASPPEASFAFSEALALLPFSFYPFNTRQHIAPPPPRSQMNLPSDPSTVVFANFNRNLKIKPDVFGVWCRLLQSTPGSVLWLRRFHRQVQANLQLQAIAHGVPNASVVFAGRLPNRGEHLGRHPLASLFLDTPRFGGHSTLADVLWAGVPAVVLGGEGLASRVGASMLLALRASPFVARDLQDYYEIAKAVTAPSKRKLLLTWRERVFQRLRNSKGPFATPNYTARFERILLLAWETFRTERYKVRNHKDDLKTGSKPPALVLAA